MFTPTNSAIPPKLNRTFSPTTIAVLITFLVTLTVGSIVIGYRFFASPNPLVGVWKATDEFGGQHFYEFREDGKLVWWDIDHSGSNGELTKRGPFHGIYYYENGAIVAKAAGLFGSRVGTLRWQSKDVLQQDSDGHIIRQNLTYTRVETTAQ